MSESIERLWRRMLMIIGRGRIKYVDDAGAVQALQVQFGTEEVTDKLPRLAEYGFTSVPPSDTDAVVVFLNGERSNGVVIATGNQQYRLTGLGSGEVCLHDDKGQRVWLSADGIKARSNGKAIEVDAEGGDVTVRGATVMIDAATTHLTGSLQVDGDFNFDGAGTNGTHAIDHTHIHTGGTFSGKTGPITP